jgi:putative glutamine amidotransferase
MKKLGITRGKKGVENYVNWLAGTDGIEVEQLEVGSNAYKDCSGILLSGGTDVDPDLYDGDKDYDLKPDEWESERDAYEETVYKYAKVNKIPVLAICRGLQLVNVVEGGTMIQDLGDLNATHRKEENDKEHAVTIDSRTLLGDITGAMSGTVNSAHHQAVEEPARPLMVNAVSKDNVIEGLEFKDKTNKGFMIAVQWHPERMQNKEVSPLSQSIKKAFLSAIRSFSR